MHSVIADAQFALRTFRRSPGFACAVVLVAGVGIGINSAVFAGLNAFFLRPLPVPRPQEIVRVYTSDARPDDRYGASSYPDYLNVRGVPSLRGLAAFVPLAATVRVGNAAVRAEGRLVSDNFFEVLEVGAGAGRLFARQTNEASDPVPIVLGHAFWRRHFAADASVVGRDVVVNGAAAVVIGVVSPAFVGIEPSQVDVYFPIASSNRVSPGFGFAADRGARLVKLIGRLAPDGNATRVTADLNVVMTALAEEFPSTNRGRLMSVTAGSGLIDTAATPINAAPIVALLFAITGVLLLITTVNVAGFLLARTVSRRRELAVRLSLGASRWRVLRQLVTESVVLGLAAEVVALALLIVLPLVARSAGVPETVRFGVDARVLAFASIVTLITALGFSVGPALIGARRQPSSDLRDGGTMALGRARAQRALVVIQVALSIALLGSAVLLVQSLRRQYLIDPGFAADRVVAAEFEGERGTPTADQSRAFTREVLAQARHLPGVLAASVTTSAPLTSEGATTTIEIPGPSPTTADVRFMNVGPDYCAALGLTIREGEELRDDVAPGHRAVLVNETMAKLYWPGRSAIGATIRRGRESLTVIGVVNDARMVALARPAGPYLYVQSDGDAASVLLIRARSSAAPLKPIVERAFSGGVGGFALRRVRTMDDVVGASLAESRVIAAATSVVSALALLLAISALYALVSYLAAQRTRELGIRVALGASRGDVVRLVLTSGTRLALVGVAIGLCATAVSATVLPAMMTLVVDDVAAVLGVATLAGAIAVAACAVPALRAARLLPAQTLRIE